MGSEVRMSINALFFVHPGTYTEDCHAGARIVMNAPECDVEIPSDACADGAHARVIRGVFVRAASLGRDSLHLDAMALWFPTWHTYRATMAYNHVEHIFYLFTQYALVPCTVYVNREYTRLLHPSRTLYEAFELCMLPRMYRYLSIAQVVAIGQDFREGFRAPLGGLLLRSTPYGTAIMLPSIAGP